MKILFILLISLFAFDMQAQYTHGATTRMDVIMIPTGYSIPSVTALDPDSCVTMTWSFDMPGSLDNASQSAALTAILTAVKDSVLERALSVWSVDTTDVTFRTVMTECKRGMKEFTIGDFKNQYQVGTDVFKCKGTTQWQKN